MAQSADKPVDRIEQLNQALTSGTYVQVKRMLGSLPPADIAHLIESLPPGPRTVLWQLIDSEDEGEVLQYLADDVLTDFLKQFSSEELATMMDGLDTDDIADMLQQLPDTVTREVLANMDQQDRQRVERVLSYPEDTAGGLMNTDTISVRPNISVDVVMRYLRRHSELPEMTDNLFVVNRKEELVGLLPLRKLLLADLSLTVREIMSTDFTAIPADMTDIEVANLFQRQDWVSAPVVDEQGKLLGRITIDDVVDVIREEAEHSLMSMAGLDEEDTYAPVLRSVRSRAPWLAVTLLTSFLAASVISLFEDAIDQIVALAVLMPIVANMGGVSGSQTLTLVIRAMALGHLSKDSTRWVLRREAIVGLCNGAIFAGLVATAAGLWFGDWRISAIIAAAMMINLMCAATAGAAIPLLLKALRIDPALAGNMALITITDVVGFSTFLGLATVFLL
ncbi:MAG TPA: magnesium transporter [Spongiibacteraceae bacterium]|jgi:magnesium transporter|nr:magnesium transporter [Spongiibacteraceae bacterium]HUH38493.1 magnesium transporter [Spongiibacteraceae bacterium]